MQRLIAHHVSGFLNLGQGRRMFMDRSIPVRPKAAAIAIGSIVTAFLVAMEVPLETVTGLLLPFVGELLDIMVDGIEVLVLPMLIASAVLPHLVPKRPVQIITQR